MVDLVTHVKLLEFFGGDEKLVGEIVSMTERLIDEIGERTTGELLQAQMLTFRAVKRQRRLQAKGVN